MGAWNAKPFGNDTALDWLWTLEKAKDASVLNATLQALLDANAEPEAPLCEEAIAAAAVIEAARREPIGKLPAEAKQWVSERGFIPSDSLVQLAIKALERIATQSELRELWEEARLVTKWQKEIDSLLAGLRKSQELPPPTRKPRSPSARLSLPKLIEKVSPDEESPLREKLRRKLEAIGDVNAPVDYIDPPLNLVAARGLIPEAERLVERGATVNPALKNPLVERTPLEVACAQGQAAMVELLLRQGAQIYRDRELDVFPSEKALKLVKKVFSVPSALYRAVESGDVATVEILVKHGVDLRDQIATEQARSCHGMWHESLLHRAAASRSAKSHEMVEYLGKHGAELGARDSLGDTPLKYAVLKRRVDLVRTLLELGAAVNPIDTEGDTPLDLVDDQKSPMATLLRQHGGRLGKEVRTS